MVYLYWPRKGTFLDVQGEREQYPTGVHDVAEEKYDRYLKRGWLDPSDDDVDVDLDARLEDEEDDSEDAADVEAENSPGAGSQEDDEDLDEDELSLNVSSNSESDDGAALDASSDEFDADEFVDRTPITEVINDLETGEYDDVLDEIEEVADRKGVQNTIEERRSETETETETEPEIGAETDSE